MADLAGVRALLMGFLALGVPYLALRKRKSGFSKAKAEYPAIARQLGLSHRAAEDSGRIGALRGTLDGHEVFVDPDERPRLVVYLKGAPPLLLRSFELEKRIPQNMVRVETRDTSLAEVFRECFAASGVAEKIRSRASELEAAYQRIRAAHVGPFASVSVNDERIEVALEMGRPAHVPSETVSAMLPALVAFARIVEEIGETTG
jgi:hypothetical protein